MTRQGVGIYGQFGENSKIAAEQARLIEQARALNELEGLLSCYTAEELSRLDHVLDLGCGPGVWAMDVAQTYQISHMVGVDISEPMIHFAQEQADTYELGSVEFQVMDVLQPLKFPDNTFDLVNARLCVSFIPRVTWPSFLLELRRIVKPGGLIRLTETEIGLTTSFAIERLAEIITQSFHKSGMGFSPTGRNLGVTSVMKSLLEHAELTIHSTQERDLDYGWGTPFYQTWHDITLSGLDLVGPYAAKLGIVAPEEFQALYEQAIVETVQEDYSALMYVRTVSARKP